MGKKLDFARILQSWPKLLTTLNGITRISLYQTKNISISTPVAPLAPQYNVEYMISIHNTRTNIVRRGKGGVFINIATTRKKHIG